MITKRPSPMLGLLTCAAALVAIPVVAAGITQERKAARSDHPRGESPLLDRGGQVLTIGGALDPHGSPDHCVECHTEDGADATAAGSTGCLRCHPDTHFHLVDMEPREVPAPAPMLLQRGRMTCATCHDEPACDGLERDGRGQNHYRGGPYPAVDRLCYRCHDRLDFQQADPHRDLLTADGAHNDAVCIFCHLGVPSTDDAAIVEQLRVDPVELCKGCHAHQIHVGIPSHLVIAPAEVAARVAEYNASHPYPLPLGPHGEITCTTCHDPHPGMEPLAVDTSPARLQALRKANRRFRDDFHLPRLRGEIEALGQEYGQSLELADGPRTKDGLLRIPVEDGSMCLVCHDVGGGYGAAASPAGDARPPRSQKRKNR